MDGDTFTLDQFGQPEGCGNGMDPTTNHVPPLTVSSEPLEATQRQLSFNDADGMEGGTLRDSSSPPAATPVATTPPAAGTAAPAVTAPPAVPKPEPVPPQSSTTPAAGVYDDGTYWKFLC